MHYMVSWLTHLKSMNTSRKESLPDDVNKIILQLNIDYIHKTGRFG